MIKCGEVLNQFRVLFVAMAASAEIITKPVANVISLRWIISARDDLVWFIGSVVSSYVLLFLYVTGLVPLVPMVALWAY